MQSDREDLNVLMRQGALAMATSDFGLALESFNALITLAPTMAEAWNKRATLYYLMRNFDASIAGGLRTGHGSVGDAVDAMRRGAVDYLQKPLDLDELRLLVERVFEQQRRDRELASRCVSPSRRFLPASRNSLLQR